MTIPNSYVLELTSEFGQSSRIHLSDITPARFGEYLALLFETGTVQVVVKESESFSCVKCGADPMEQLNGYYQFGDEKVCSNCVGDDSFDPKNFETPWAQIVRCEHCGQLVDRNGGVRSIKRSDGSWAWQCGSCKREGSKSICNWCAKRVGCKDCDSAGYCSTTHKVVLNCVSYEKSPFADCKFKRRT